MPTPTSAGATPTPSYAGPCATTSCPASQSLTKPPRTPHRSASNGASPSLADSSPTPHRLLTDEEIPLLTRVAVVIVLLYAQPVTRILQLTINDVIQETDGIALRFGDPPSPVPEPFAALLLRYLDQ